MRSDASQRVTSSPAASYLLNNVDHLHHSAAFVYVLYVIQEVNDVPSPPPHPTPSGIRIDQRDQKQDLFTRILNDTLKQKQKLNKNNVFNCCETRNASRSLHF